MRTSALITTVAIALLSIGLIIVATNDSDENELQRLCNEAEKEIYAIHWNEAERHLQQALAIDNNNAAATALLASLHTVRGRTADARATAERAAGLLDTIRDEDERRLVMLRLANFAGIAGMRQVDSLLVLLHETRPDNIFVLGIAAGRAQQQGKTDEAEHLWRRILALEPNHAAAYNSLGYLAAEQGHYDEAANLMRKYVYLAPDVANAHDSLGEILTFTGRYEEAASEYRQALSAQPDLFFSRLGLGRIFLAIGRLDQGIEILSETRTLLAGTDHMQNVDQILIQLYFTHELGDELDAAIGNYLRQWPDDFFASGPYRALQAANRGWPKKALAIHDSTLTVWRALPQYTDNNHFRRQVDRAALRFRAQIAMLNTDFAGAADLWRQELANGMDRPPHRQFNSRYGYALALAETGRCEEALENTRFNLRINPRLHRTMILQARCCLESRRLVKARETLDMLGEAIADADSNYFARHELAMLRETLQAAGP